jgi:hypothetical protein
METTKQDHKKRGSMKTLILFSCLIFASTAQAQLTPPVRIVSGTTTPYTDSHGNLWVADEDFNVGTSRGLISNAITGTADPTLYQNERYSLNDLPAMVYTIPAPSGTYTLNLYFSENYVTAVGQRLFNIKVNGTPVLTNFDIFATAGAMHAAVIKTFAVSSKGTILIEFDHTNPAVQNPKIDAIELIPLTQTLATIPLLINTSAPSLSSILFDDKSVVYTGPITVQQWGVVGNVLAGTVSVDVNGDLSGMLNVNPNPGNIDANGNMTFLFTMPNIPGLVSQTVSAAEFQQGALGITLNMVVYKAPLLAPKPGAVPQLILKSFGVGLTP